MSSRPSRRAAVARRKVIQSDSDTSEVEDSQPTNARRESRRSTVGSRASFDDEYTPKKPRQSVPKTPANVLRRAETTPASRAPLTEARKGRTQSQTPRTTTKRNGSRHVDIIKEGFEGSIVNDSQKENAVPAKVLPVNFKMEMPPPPTLPLHTLQRTKVQKPETTVEIAPSQDNVATEAAPEVPLGPKTRIVISKLVLENFKSYAGVQIIGPFHKSFSAVVGPNGSGKSNVIDSLLFVFGFRASKMRQGKISALIHNSAAHPDLGQCSVEVHFETIYDDADDPADYRVVDDSTIIVARKAYKNNSSKYTINERESSFTEVTTLLKDRGIDLDHKRFLILQGEVESIAQMRPKAANEHDDGLLEYLEDIIGTSKYKAPIEGALERMEALNGICQEKNSRVQIVEKERTRLEERKDVAIKLILAENDLAVKQSALYQLFASECRSNLSLTQGCIDELEAELQSGTDSFKGNGEKVAELEQKHKDASKNHEKLKGMLAKYSARAAQAEKANVSLQEKVKHLSKKKKKVSKSIETSEHALNECTSQIENFDETIKKTKAEIVALDDSLSKEDQELRKIRLALKDQTQHITDQIEAKQKQKQPWDAQIAEKQSALDVARAEFDMLNEKSAQVERDLEASTEQIRSLAEESTNKNLELQRVASDITESNRSIANVTKQIAKRRATEMSAKREHSSAREKADEAKSNFAASQQKGDVLTGLTNLRDSGRISGFHGRLGDLGTIDDKYDVAITTACPSLNNIVVDNVEVGQQCIEHLKRNNLGRANFLLLDKLPAPDTNTIKTPEDVPRLLDLVRPRDQQFRAAFQKILGNTVVAKDLDQANRIAYGKSRWRVVTLDGQLIEASGAMTGGGTRVSKGGMSSKFASSETRESVSKLEKDESSKQVALDEILKEIRNLETELTRLNSELPALETRQSRLTIEIGALEKQEKDLKKRIEELSATKRSANTDTKRITEIEKSMPNYEKALAKLTLEASSIDAEIKKLEEQILEAGGIQLRKQKSVVDGLRASIEAKTQMCDSTGFNRAKAEKDTEKHSKAHENGEAELAVISGELAALQQQISGDSSDAIVNKEMEETKYAIEDSLSRLEEIKEKLDIQTTSMNESRAKELELNNKLDDHKKRHAEDLKRSAHWNDKLEKLSIQELSEHFISEDVQVQALYELSEDELRELDKNELKAEIALLEESTQNTKVETGVLDEYLRRCEEYAERARALEEAVTERDMARSTAEDLRRRRLTEFMTGFNLISLRLKEMYQMITMGGNAELELVDSLDPFSEGILFSVMPPKKSWKNISNLSGGEKTLSSLALVFALHHYKPTPLYVMDEIDAALDFRNVSIVASYIKDRTKNAQFIVISLRNNMFELSARLVGIYKTNNMTKSIAIANSEIPVVVRKKEEGATQA